MQNSLLSSANDNGNDNGDNNEKTKWSKSMGGNILGGIFPRKNPPGENLIGGNFPVLVFQRGEFS